MSASRLKLGLIVLAAVGLACGDSDDTSDTGTGTETATMTSPTGTVTPTTETTTTNGTATTAPMTDSTDTGTDSTADETTNGTTVGVDMCEGMDQAACEGDAGCKPVMCREYMDNPGADPPFCLAEAAYIGCVQADGLVQPLATNVCEGDDAPVYLCPDTCSESSFMICDPPTDGDVQPCE